MPNPLIVHTDDVERLQIVGEELSVLAAGTQTGSYEIFHQGGPEGSGPPPHQHDWDEAFFIISGELIVGLGDEPEVSAKPGTLVHVPAGTVHWFRFGTGGGTMLSVTNRQGPSDFFIEAAREVHPTEPDLGQLVGIATSHGVNIAIPG